MFTLYFISIKYTIKKLSFPLCGAFNSSFTWTSITQKKNTGKSSFWCVFFVNTMIQQNIHKFFFMQSLHEEKFVLDIFSSSPQVSILFFLALVTTETSTKEMRREKNPPKIVNSGNFIWCFMFYVILHFTRKLF
jgi:hypothetical protein